jgi:hypothetical protein
MVSSYARIGISIPNNITRIGAFFLSYFQHGVRKGAELHDPRTPRSGHALQDQYWQIAALACWGL